MDLQIKVTGYGNQIKTKLINITEIANMLNRDPNEIANYISKKIGTIVDSEFNLKGSCDVKELKNLLNQYIHESTTN
jgi:translation initiation factor 2 beta subunit (eIF-2beta)/eIF-5